MHTLILNGSPRKNGDTMSLIKELCTNLSGDITLVNTYYDNIAPCVDCRYCYTHDKCSINDNMEDIYKKIYFSDNIVIASPLYFNELTGSLLSFASRLQLLFASKYIRKVSILENKIKKGGLIIVGGGSTKDTTCAESTAKTILNEMNVHLIKTIKYINTDKITAINDINTVNEIRILSNLFNNEI